MVMKYRIIQNSDGEYLVQWKYKLRPFRISNKKSLQPDGMSIEAWVTSLRTAEFELGNIRRKHKYKNKVKVLNY